MGKRRNSQGEYAISSDVDDNRLGEGAHDRRSRLRRIIGGVERTQRGRSSGNPHARQPRRAFRRPIPRRLVFVIGEKRQGLLEVTDFGADALLRCSSPEPSDDYLAKLHAHVSSVLLVLVCLLQEQDADDQADQDDGGAN